MAAVAQILSGNWGTQSAEHQQSSQRLKFSHRDRRTGNCYSKCKEKETVAKSAQKLSSAVQTQLVLERVESVEQKSCESIGQAQAEQLGRAQVITLNIIWRVNQSILIKEARD